MPAAFRELSFSFLAAEKKVTGHASAAILKPNPNSLQSTKKGKKGQLMTLYDELIKRLKPVKGKNNIKTIKKSDTLRVIEIESIGNNNDTITIEFDFKYNLVEIQLKQDVEGKDELSIYRNVSKANMRIDDGLIVYIDKKLILRSVSDSKKFENAESLLQQIAYLEIVAITFFLSIVQNSNPESE